MIAGSGSGIFNAYQDAQKLAPIFNLATEPNQERARDGTNLIAENFRSFYLRLKG
jgi:hypothetical protein